MQWTLRLLIAGTAIGLATTAQAGPLVVAGSPGYDPDTSTGLKYGSVYATPGRGVNNVGTAVGLSQKYVAGTDVGIRAVRWDASGTAVELDSLGTDDRGYGYARAYAVNNNAGMAVGASEKYVDGVFKGYRAVRWDATGTTIIELKNLGTDRSGFAYSCAFAVNDSGITVGYSDKYDVDNAGQRAVRWDASGTSVTELGSLGTTNSGLTSAQAYAVNNSGVAVGYSINSVDGISKGACASRWDASGAVTELVSLGIDSSGRSNAYAYAVNDSGTAVGYSDKYVGGAFKGTRAVRWDASGTAAAELGNLGVNSSGVTSAYAYSVNVSGTAAGYAEKYVDGVSKGYRAVRWDATGNATELGNLGTATNGVAYNYAFAVNDAGLVVGTAPKYIGDGYGGSRAVIWLPDASVLDLNELGVASVSGGGTWMLGGVNAISADGWVAGEGGFDPDGDGPLFGYSRLWVAQVGLGGTWTKATGGTWGRGPNWSTGTPAMQVGNATFNLNAAYTVALDRDELTKTMAVNAGTVTIDFQGHKLTTESGLGIANGARLGLNASGSEGQLLGGISGDGGLTKTGSGALTLSGNNAYQGGTIVAEGRLQVTGTLTNNGSDKVLVAKDADGLLGNGSGDASITRRVVASGTYAGLGSAITNLSAGELPTKADILGGNAGIQADVSMAWRTRTVGEKTQTGGGLIGEVLDLGGIAHATGSDQTDTFVLQMSYDEGELARIWGLTESQAIAQGELYLGSLDLSDNAWHRAVDSNFGGTAHFVGSHPYDASYFTLGNYGVDTANNVVWAVVNHNSQFAAVPEPGTFALLGVAAVGLLGYVWRRRRAV